MPFQSQAQQRYLFLHNPTVAKEFADKTSSEQYQTMPYKVSKDPMQEAIKRRQLKLREKYKNK